MFVNITYKYIRLNIKVLKDKVNISSFAKKGLGIGFNNCYSLNIMKKC